MKKRRTGPCKICRKVGVEIPKGLPYALCDKCGDDLLDEIERMVEGKGKSKSNEHDDKER